MAKNYNFAFKVDNLIDDYFENFTGLTNMYNYLSDGKAIDDLETQYIQYIEQPDIRRALHVGATKFDQDTTFYYMVPDQAQSVAPWVRELLSNYRMLFYAGQLDVIVNYLTVLNFLQHLNFSSREEYKTAPRQKWYVGKDLAGYVKVAGNLSEVLVRDAGHMVPFDQPKWAFDLISKFVRNKSLID